MPLTKAQQKKLIMADIDKIKRVVNNTNFEKIQTGSGFVNKVLKAVRGVISSPLASDIKDIALKEVLVPLIRGKMATKTKGSGLVLAGSGLVVAGGSGLKLSGQGGKGCPCKPKRKPRTRRTKK